MKPLKCAHSQNCLRCREGFPVPARDVVRTGFKIGLYISSGSNPSLGGVRLHDGDATHETLSAFPLFFYLPCESLNLIVIVLVLNGRARGDPEPLFGGT